MLLHISHAEVQLGEHVVLTDADFEIRNNEKIAVVGRNGCGKTTLLRLISGELPFTAKENSGGTYAKTGEPVIGYLKQNAFSDLSLTMEQELRKELREIEAMKADLEEKARDLKHNYSEAAVAEYTALEETFKSLGGYFYEKEYETLVRMFGFSEEDKKKPLSAFSGGQQTKIAFIRLLMQKPDVLLLDEPTNHLDISTIEWLETYLRTYEKALVLVSHDRMFIDRVASEVVEISYGETRRFRGNYTDYVRQKRELYERQKKEYLAQQKEIQRLTELVERFKAKPTKAAMARSKLKAIEHMNRIDPPDRYDSRTFHAQFQPEIEAGKDVLQILELAVGYDQVLQNVNLDIKKGEKIGIIGQNGIGKSTFLKTLVGQLPALGGSIQYGVHAEVGYFDQQIAQNQSADRVIDELWQEFPSMTETEVRSALGAFLFTGDDVFKEVRMLSGGEKVRLALCKILRKRPNILILDEPTNHLDIIGKETLEEMLISYAGTLIFVSHDRYFVKKVATSLLSMEPGRTTLYRFGYEEYEEKRALAQQTQPQAPQKTPKEKTAERNPGKERSRLEKKLQKAEAALMASEEQLEALKTAFSDPAIQSDYEQLSALQEQIDAQEEAVLSDMELWNRLSEELNALT